MAQSKSQKHRRHFDKVATAIGHICIGWGHLERDLNEFIQALTPLDEGDISRSITANMDVRSKIQVIKALAFLRKPSKEWFEKMTILLDYIDNSIRPRRNRYVHDAWYKPGGKFIRSTHQIKFERPQSFQLELHTETINKSDMRAINKLIAELHDLVVINFVFWYDFAYPDEQRALQSKHWKRFLRRAKPDAHPTYVNSIRQHPLRSSRA